MELSIEAVQNYSCIGLLPTGVRQAPNGSNS